MQVYPITPRQREVLEAIREFAANGCAPTLAELGERVGMSSSLSVRRHLKALTKKGFLKPRAKNKHRQIALVAEPKAA